jgi:hypothetical protein
LLKAASGAWEPATTVEGGTNSFTGRHGPLPVTTCPATEGVDTT